MYYVNFYIFDLESVIIYMIDYTQIKNPEYVRSLINDIHSTDDLRVLNDLIKNISVSVAYQKITYNDVSEIIFAIKSRTNEIVASRRNQRNNQSKSLAIAPVGSNNRHHSIINETRGASSLIFIVINIAITTVMYTLLLIANFLK